MIDIRIDSAFRSLSLMHAITYIKYDVSRSPTF